MNCNSYQTEIDELSDAAPLSAESLRHLENCSDCRKFSVERATLRQMLRALPPVEAPKDFNFRFKSRLRQTQQNAQPFFGVRTIWLTSSAVALSLVLVLTFVLTRHAAPVTQPENGFIAATAPETPLTSKANQSKIPDSSPKTRVLETNNPPPTLAAMRDSGEKIAGKKAVVKSSSPRKFLLKKEVFSIDSGVDKAKPSIVPDGFNDPAAAPKKLSAAGLLRTVGIETENKAEGLSVISVNPIGQAAGVDLQVGDIIQKVNGENPLAISGNEFKGFNLTIRRKNQTREINIPTKPQN